MTALLEPLSLPFDLESCIHEASALAAHVTGSPQVPVVFSIIFCPGGSGCKRVAVNDRWVGATCSMQVFGGIVGVVAGIDVGTGVAVPGAGVTVPGVVVLVIPVAVPVPVFIPGVPPVDVDMGVLATGEMVGVCVSPGRIVEPTCGERTLLVPVVAAMFVSDEGCCCKIFTASRTPPVIREIAPSIIKTGRPLRTFAGRMMRFACSGSEASWRFNREVLHSSQKIVVSIHDLLQLRH